VDAMRAEMRERIDLWEGKMTSLNEQLAEAQERENQLRKELDEKLQEIQTDWQGRLVEAERQTEATIVRGDELSRELERLSREGEQNRMELDQTREQLIAADREKDRAQNLTRQYEEAMNSAIREKEEMELRAMQELESKQDHYIKELERVRSSHITEMTRINQNYLQRGKALKIAELENQRLKEKIADLEKRPAAASPRAAIRHGPGSGAAPLAGGTDGGAGDFDIDRVLDGLNEKE